MSDLFFQLLQVSTAVAVFEESCRFALGKQEAKVFNVINFGSHQSPIGALKVQCGFHDLADVCCMQANHTGVVVRNLKRWRMIVVDEESLPGALLLSVDFNVAAWGAKSLRDAEVLRKRVNRLRASNGLPGWLVPAEKDLNGALAEVCREEFQKRVALSLGGLGGENAPAGNCGANKGLSGGVERIFGGGAEEGSGAVEVGGVVGSSFLREKGGARAPVSGISKGRKDVFGVKAGKFPESGAKIPESGSAPSIMTRARTPAVDIDQDQSTNRLSISSKVPESGSNALGGWRRDGYIMDKLGRFAALSRELASGKTGTGFTSRLALEFNELYELSPDTARVLIGQMADLDPTFADKKTNKSRPTNHAAWLNSAVHDKLSQMAGNLG